MVLATVANRESRETTTVAHTVTPAVPAVGTARVVRYGEVEGWNLRLVRSAEFDDEQYLSNPVDRCYHCKNNLYQALGGLDVGPNPQGSFVLSGANVDDLGEYRPGLVAAEEHGVRHPYLEAGLTKAEVRAVGRLLALDVADIASSPCLASRIYTGTRVTAENLRAVEIGEATLSELTGIMVGRCRIREHEIIVEVSSEDRAAITPAVLASIGRAMRSASPALKGPRLDERPYRSGQAFVQPG